MDARRKFFLFKQSTNFCAVPWNHAQIYSNGMVRTCARGEIRDSLFENSLDQIVAGAEFSDLRNTLIEDRAHANCESCQNYHNQDHHYLRGHYNSIFRTVNQDYDRDEFRLHGIDLHWDNTCNLKCVYCNPVQSSSIAHEQKITFAKPKSQHLDSVIDAVIENQWNFKEIYFSGGEPMLIRRNLEILSRLDNKHIPIRINSNITHAVEGNAFFEAISKFTNVLWTISAEAQFDRYNYIRSGSDWAQFVNNLERIKGLGHGLRINSVWFVGSVSSLVDTIKYFMTQHGITDITVNQLEKHSYLQARNAPPAVKQQALQRLDEFVNSGVLPAGSNSYHNVMRCVEELKNEVEDHQGYKDYFDELDRRRGTNWRQALPELA